MGGLYYNDLESKVCCAPQISRGITWIPPSMPGTNLQSPNLRLAPVSVLMPPVTRGETEVQKQRFGWSPSQSFGRPDSYV